jgi:hypothetical protein
MSVSTKKSEKPRTKEDLAVYRESVKKGESLRAIRRELGEQVRARGASSVLVDASDAEMRVANMATALTADPATNLATVSIAELEPRLAEQIAAADRAIGSWEAAHARVLNVVERELYESDYAEAHRQLRRAIVRAVLALRKAFDDEQQFAIEMHQAGALANVTQGYRLFANFSSAAKLPHAIRGMNLPGFIASNKNLLNGDN